MNVRKVHNTLTRAIIYDYDVTVIFLSHCTSVYIICNVLFPHNTKLTKQSVRDKISRRNKKTPPPFLRMTGINDREKIYQK